MKFYWKICRCRFSYNRQYYRKRFYAPITVESIGHTNGRIKRLGFRTILVDYGLDGYIEKAKWHITNVMCHKFLFF
jgi:hypothetical protein